MILPLITVYLCIHVSLHLISWSVDQARYIYLSFCLSFYVNVWPYAFLGVFLCYPFLTLRHDFSRLFDLCHIPSFFLSFRWVFSIFGLDEDVLPFVVLDSHRNVSNGLDDRSFFIAESELVSCHIKCMGLKIKRNVRAIIICMEPGCQER